MRIVAYASRSHYAAHLRPIVDALPESDREIYSPFDDGAWGPQLPAPPRRMSRNDRMEKVVWLVASYVDAQKVNGPFVYVEHGAGQSYGGDEGASLNASYAGGEGRSWDDCLLIIAPGNVAGARHMAARKCPVALIGCPYLDPWHRGERPVWPFGNRPPDLVRAVVFSFHWNASEVCPEARSALAHYESGLEGVVTDLVGRGWQVWGHGHPREEATLRPLWYGLDVPWADRETILDRAAVLVVDNSSLGWEFMALGKPVVWLDAPWYRRGVDHGLRFWRWAEAGVRVDGPEGVAAAVDIAYRDEEPRPTLRAMATREVYAYSDGSSTERAVTAIMEAIRG